MKLITLAVVASVLIEGYLSASLNGPLDASKNVVKRQAPISSNFMPPQMGGFRPNIGPPNMGPFNMGPPNMGPFNMGPPNMGSPGMGPPNMGPPNMGPPNMGPLNMGLPNMGPLNMGLPNMGAMRPPNMMPPNMIRPPTDSNNIADAAASNSNDGQSLSTDLDGNPVSLETEYSAPVGNRTANNN